jgi:adenosine deaminase
MDYRQLPKIELHLHLDCSLSYKVVHQIDASITLAQYQDSFIAPPKCTDLLDYLTRAVKGFELMQTPEQLRLVTLDLLEQLDADQVIYAEIRFAPLLHIAKGLTAEQVVAIVNDAVSEGKEKYKVIAKLILCTLRNYSEEQSFQTVKLVEKFKNTHVVGFDIAGDEAGFPIDAHKKAFNYAKAAGIHCTAHAGEACGASSVKETIEQFGPTRIGHGIRSVEDDKVIQLLIDKDVHLEVCPTSNVQTNIFPTIKEHAIDQVYQKGVSLSINCDAKTITPVTLSSEYAALETAFAWTTSHFLRCNLEAIRHCFADEETKQKLRLIIQKAYSNSH